MSTSMSIKIDFRVVSVLLLIVILVMLGLWRPWQPSTNYQRKITVSGEATIKAEPDQYQFSPSYTSTNTDRTQALAELTARSNQIVGELKKLGVKDSQIKNNLSDYSSDYALEPNTNATLVLTVTITDKTVAQKAQDYLLTTSPSGAVTPYLSFSTTKRHELEDQARGKALGDARAKARQTAERLDAKLGKVLTVSDSNNSGGFMPFARSLAADAAGTAKTQSLTLQPGENDLTFSVEATFAIN